LRERGGLCSGWQRGGCVQWPDAASWRSGRVGFGVGLTFFCLLRVERLVFRVYMGTSVIRKRTPL